MNTQRMRETFERAFTPACHQAGDNPEAWLKGQIDRYSQQAARQEVELKKTQTMLRGLQTWLQDVERRKGGQL